MIDMGGVKPLNRRSLIAETGLILLQCIVMMIQWYRFDVGRSCRVPMDVPRDYNHVAEIIQQRISAKPSLPHMMGQLLKLYLLMVSSAAGIGESK